MEQQQLDIAKNN